MEAEQKISKKENSYNLKPALDDDIIDS